MECWEEVEFLYHSYELLLVSSMFSLITHARKSKQLLPHVLGKPCAPVDMEVQLNRSL